MRGRGWRFAIHLLLVSVGLHAAATQAADPPQIKTYKLELKQMKGIEHGKAAVVKGEVGKQPHRFYVEGLNAYMPVAVLARPVRANDKVTVRLTKHSWDHPLREGTADGEPVALKLRTEGEFQIQVTAPKENTPYRLLVWAGDEVKPELRPVIVKASEFQGESSGSSSLVLWVIAAALIAIVALLAVLVLRRKPA